MIIVVMTKWYRSSRWEEFGEYDVYLPVRPDKKSRHGLRFIVWKSCNHITCGRSDALPNSCRVCAEIKAAEDKRGEEVLDLFCKIECNLCNEGMPQSEYEFGSWFHFINDKAYRCECEFYRQAYREKYGGK